MSSMDIDNNTTCDDMLAWLAGQGHPEIAPFVRIVYAGHVEWEIWFDTPDQEADAPSVMGVAATIREALVDAVAAVSETKARKG